MDKNAGIIISKEKGRLEILNQINQFTDGEL